MAAQHAGQVFGEALTLRGRSCVRFGKDPSVNGVVLQHPSISKQHAVIQFRRSKASPKVEPWIMDLESVNKTYLYATDLVWSSSHVPLEIFFKNAIKL